MSDIFEAAENFVDRLIDSFWAGLPEQTADDLAKFKKDVLTSIKSNVTSLVDHEINETDRHLENARRMREERRQRQHAPETPPASPA